MVVENLKKQFWIAPSSSFTHARILYKQINVQKYIQTRTTISTIKFETSGVKKLSDFFLNSSVLRVFAHFFVALFVEKEYTGLKKLFSAPDFD